MLPGNQSLIWNIHRLIKWKQLTHKDWSKTWNRIPLSTVLSWLWKSTTIHWKQWKGQLERKVFCRRQTLTSVPYPAVTAEKRNTPSNFHFVEMCQNLYRVVLKYYYIYMSCFKERFLYRTRLSDGQVAQTGVCVCACVLQWLVFTLTR